MLPYQLIDVREYNDWHGRSPYAVWFNSLNAQAAAKVVTALTRPGARQLLEREMRGLWLIRIQDRLRSRLSAYFGKDGDRLGILLGGGTKKRQQQDIETALARWQDYK